MTWAQTQRSPAGTGLRGQTGMGLSRPGHLSAPPPEPSPNSVRGRILADLRQGHALTAADAWQRHGTSRLAAHVHALRATGWRIIADTVKVQCRGGRSARVAMYRLPGGRP